MKYLSVCSGIEAATQAWHSLGWEPIAFSEIEKFPSKVLAHHYPAVPNLGDMTNFKEWNLGTIDLLVGGTPCQSFSVAGLRKGLDDPRGNLMLTYLAIADRFKPKWLVWENVPGVLSSNEGRDFGAFLGGLAELGYGFAYRILDAQYFGLAQRRRRVFVVGCLGDWRSAAAVLFERESLCGNPVPSRSAKEDIAGTVTTRTCRSVGAQDAACGHLISVFDRQSSSEYGEQDIASTMTARDYKSASDLIAYGMQANIIGRQDHNGGNGLGFAEEIAPTLTKTDQHGVIAFDSRQDCVSSSKVFGVLGSSLPQSQAVLEVAGTMVSRNSSGGFSNSVDHAAAGYMAIQCSQVRRLMPVECERLQGFPRGYTNIPGASDSARYKALGNSMAVPCMAWIGQRIQQVEDLSHD